MDFYSKTVNLKWTTDRVQQILIAAEHIPFIDDHEGVFKHLTVYLRWEIDQDGVLMGRLSYFHHKNLRVFRIYTEQKPRTNGSELTLISDHGRRSKLLMNLSWGLGFFLCVVGLIIPRLQTRAFSKQLKSMVDETSTAPERMSSQRN